MAFDRKELALVAVSGAGDNVSHVYLYANSAGDTVTAANFFDDAADQINTGDILFVTGGTPRLTSLTNTTGTITLTDLDVTAA